MIFFSTKRSSYGIHHFIERVIERAHVGIDFLLQRAGKKAEALAGFDGRTRKDDAIDFFGEQRGNRHGYGEICFSRAAGTDGEDHVVALDIFHVEALVGAFGRDIFFAEAARTRFAAEDGMQRRLGIFGGHAEQGFHLAVVHRAAGADQAIVFIEDAHGALDLRGIAFDQKAVVVDLRRDLEGGFQQFQIFVERAEKGLNTAGDFYGVTHEA
jgi:hypothetical protein